MFSCWWAHAINIQMLAERRDANLRLRRRLFYVQLHATECYYAVLKLLLLQCNLNLI
jgi:hypothetical protein